MFDTIQIISNWPLPAYTARSGDLTLNNYISMLRILQNTELHQNPPKD